MNTWWTPTEVQIVVAEKLWAPRRERVTLNPRRRFRVRNLATALLSLIF
jgi:hypothetical protein